MIFYVIERGNAPHHLVITQLEAQQQAKEHHCTYSKLDVPTTSKDELLAYLNGLYAQIEPEPDTSDIPETTEASFEAASLAYNPQILEGQIEALGAKGMTGLDQLNSYQELQGIGANFARGVILLCILAAGEHQLARVFHKAKKK